jgi:hypothetical protein
MREWPLVAQELNDLGEHLDGRTCDGTLKRTIQFLRNRKLPVDEVVEWLKSHSAFCDCEVLLNVLTP